MTVHSRSRKSTSASDVRPEGHEPELPATVAPPAGRVKTPKLNRDGLPIDGRDWTEADWADLHHAIEKVKHNIRERHQLKGDQ